jgi:hypothetical protein
MCCLIHGSGISQVKMTTHIDFNVLSAFCAGLPTSTGRNCVRQLLPAWFYRLFKQLLHYRSYKMRYSLWLANRPTPGDGTFTEKRIVAQLVRTLPAFYKARRFINRVRKGPPIDPILSHTVEMWGSLACWHRRPVIIIFTHQVLIFKKDWNETRGHVLKLALIWNNKLLKLDVLAGLPLFRAHIHKVFSNFCYLAPLYGHTVGAQPLLYNEATLLNRYPVAIKFTGFKQTSFPYLATWHFSCCSDHTL